MFCFGVLTLYNRMFRNIYINIFLLAIKNHWCLVRTTHHPLITSPAISTQSCLKNLLFKSPIKIIGHNGLKLDSSGCALIVIEFRCQILSQESKKNTTHSSSSDPMYNMLYHPTPLEKLIKFD